MHSQQGTAKCSSVVSISEGQACRIALKHCLGQIGLFWHLTVVKMSYMSFFSPNDLCKKIAGIIQQWYILKLYTVVRLLQMYRYWGSSGSYLLRQVLDPPVGVRSKKKFFLENLETVHTICLCICRMGVVIESERDLDTDMRTICFTTTFD